MDDHVIIVPILLILGASCFGVGYEMGQRAEQADIIRHCEEENIFMDRNVMIQCKVAKSKML